MSERDLKRKIVEGVRSLAVIPFFPADEYAQEGIMHEISKFVDRADRLTWLISTAIQSMREWKGIPELRGLYCTRFRPADGIEQYCTIAGFTPADCEAQHAIDAQKFKELSSPDVFALLEAPHAAPVFVDPTPDQLSRTLRGIEQLEAQDRLRAILGAGPRPPVKIAGSPKRTPEENAEIIRDLERKLKIRGGNAD